MKNRHVACLTVSAVVCGLSFVAADDIPKWDSENAIPAKSTRIEIKDKVEISVDIPGTITTLKPNFRGGVVEAGQVVVELDANVAKAQEAEAEAKAQSTVLIDFAKHALANAEFELDSKKRRNESTRASTGRDIYTPDEIRELDLAVVKAKAELSKSLEDQKLAQLALKTKRAELAQFTRVANFGGIVTDLHTKSVGSAVRQGDPIMTIVNLDKVIAALTIDPSYEDRVNVGDTVLVRRRRESAGEGGGSLFQSQNSRRLGEARLASVQPPSKADEEVFVGKVIFIRPVKIADEENSFEIEAEIQNRADGPGKYLLREGSFVEAVVLSEE
ncbi:MAG: HlyD family efflux transporter periplasmic adaptor subunit [Planctomycetaceae bacterium]